MHQRIGRYSAHAEVKSLWPVKIANKGNCRVTPSHSSCPKLGRARGMSHIPAWRVVTLSEFDRPQLQASQ